MIKKMDRAIKILHREQKRREGLPIKNRKYLSEMVFLRTFIRGLQKKVANVKMKDGRYPVLLSESQWEGIQGMYDQWSNTSQPRFIAEKMQEDYSNLKNQIKIAKGE